MSMPIGDQSQNSLNASQTKSQQAKSLKIKHRSNSKKHCSLSQLTVSNPHQLKTSLLNLPIPDTRYQPSIMFTFLIGFISTITTRKAIFFLLFFNGKTVLTPSYLIGGTFWFKNPFPPKIFWISLLSLLFHILAILKVRFSSTCSESLSLHVKATKDSCYDQTQTYLPASLRLP